MNTYYNQRTHRKMVKLCSNEYPSDNEELYKTHFEQFSYPLSPFQKHAIEAIVEGHHVLVTAHTGSGKTLPAEFAIRHFTDLGKKVIYCSPIKALSNQKYHDFSQKFPGISCGLFTGDIKTNPNADVLIMTTEILMNYLFLGLNSEKKETASLQFQIDIQNELACVIFDEVHYINDKERGQVWEKSILMLPTHIQMIMLSATIDNPEGFAHWCERGLNGETDKKVYLAPTSHRVVPLTHYGFLTTTEAIFKQVKDKVLEKEIRESTNILVPLQTSTGQFQENGFRTISKMTQLFSTHNVEMKRKHVLNQLAGFMKERDMLPAIAFVFSRKHVELCAADIHVELLEFDSKVGYTIRRECEQIIRKLPNYKEYLELPEYNRLVSLLEKGIGIHHSGMIPILREIVELMISKKYIKLLFATESFAIGLDCPIRTAVFTSLKKFDGNGERYLMAHEYSQMAGRAGRRGIDTIGHVVHCNNLFQPPSLTDYKIITGGIPQKLVSKFRISYPLILNLLKNGQTADFHLFSEKSMIYNEIQVGITGQMNEIADLEKRIVNKTESLALTRTPKAVCDRYIELETQYKTAVNKKRKEVEKEMRSITEMNKTLSEDVRKMKEYNVLCREYEDKKESLHYTQNYLNNQTDNICGILVKEGFIEKTETEYCFTKLGSIASNIAEIHPLILTKWITIGDNEKNGWNYFSDFSVVQLVGLFSCFTDVKVSTDMKLSSTFSLEDGFLKKRIDEMSASYQKYDELECDMDIRSGIRYDEAIIYDMVDISMKWCDCSDEVSCKEFIQTVVADKGISIGDFTKAMLKIVTVSKEWIGVCEAIGEMEMLYKLNSIEEKVLKYVATTQSLYV